MKKIVLYSILCVIAVSLVLLSCSEELGYMADTSHQGENSELVCSAKQILQSRGGEISLPAYSSRKTSLSRSSLIYLSGLEPLWDESFTHNQGNETILIVPLRCEEDIRSTLSIIEGEETTYQFAKVFSRMIVKPSQGENGIYVLTYMPESNYASSLGELESEMRYNPTAVGYTGFIVSSRLNGEVMRGYLYEQGAISHYFSPGEAHHCHDESCTEHHHHEPEGVKVTFSLQSANKSRSAYGSNSEDYMCPFCFKFGEHCICIEMFAKCPTCGMYKEFCSCGINDMGDLCAKCGEYKKYCICNSAVCPTCKQVNCICITSPIEPCKYCGEVLCVCDKPNPEPNPTDTCDVCHEDPCICCKKCGETFGSCICVNNMTPVLYTPHNNDFKLAKEMESCVVANSCSAFAALETACSIYGSTVSQNDLYVYYTYMYNMSPGENMQLDMNSDFMVNLFMFNPTQNIENAVSRGFPVIVRYNNAYITVVGIQYDGDIIYADHSNGYLYVVHKNYFNGSESIVIEGVPQELPSPYLLE